MGLATRIIPMLLHAHGALIKGVRFDAWRNVGHALQAARIHQARGVDEMLLLDVAATPEGLDTDLQLVGNLTADCFMPITAGGGVRSLQDVQGLLRAGADKVAIGAAIYTHPGIIRECSRAVGNQGIVAVLETDHGKTFAHGGVGNPPSPEHMAKLLEIDGAGEILLMARDRDGTMEGYDLDTLVRVARAVDVPVIAAGGAGSYAQMDEAIRAGASAVAAGALFQWGDATPKAAAQYLAQRGHEVRL